MLERPDLFMQGQDVKNKFADIDGKIGILQTSVSNNTSQLSENATLIGGRLAGEIDDTNRINRAIASGNNRIIFKTGETYVTSSHITLRDGLRLEGNGCTLKGGYGFDVGNTNKVIIENFVFDGDATTNKRAYGVYASLGNFQRLTIKNNTFKSSAILISDLNAQNTKSRYLSIEGNKFMGNYGLKTNGYYDTIYVRYCDDISITDNIFDGEEMYRFVKLVGKISPLSHPNVVAGMSISNPEDANTGVLIAHNKFYGSLQVFPNLTYAKQAIDLYYGNNKIDIIYNDFNIKNSVYPTETLIESKNFGDSPGSYNNAVEYINISHNKMKGKMLRAVKVHGIRGTGVNEIESVVKITNNEVECEVTQYHTNDSACFFDVLRIYRVEIEKNNCKFKLSYLPANTTGINAVYHSECEYTRIANNTFRPLANLNFVGVPTVPSITFQNVTIMKEIVIEGNYIEYYGYRALTYNNIGTSLPDPITVLKVLNNNFVNTVDTQPFTNIVGKFKHISYFNNRQTSQTFIKDLGLMSLSPIVNDSNDWSYATGVPAGQWYARQVIYSKDPATTKCVGWVCTVSGNPATWVPFGTFV